MARPQSTAVVTGAGSGIGKAVAVRFSNAEHHLLLVDNDAAGLESTLLELRQSGHGAETCTADLTDPQQADAVGRVSTEAFSRLDILVVAHGTDLVGDVDETTFTQWQSIVSTNLNSVFLIVKALLPLLRRSPSASIVTVASVAASVAMGKNAGYSAAKGGVVALTRELAVDLAHDGIRANTVCPGPTDTPLLMHIMHERGLEMSTVIGRIPLRRVARPSDIASAVAFLASPDSDFITGHALVVDGGYSIW